MTNRYRDFQEDLSRELIKSKKKRTLLFNELREDYENDLEVVRKFIKFIGQKEYADLCGISASNLSNYLKEGKDLKLSTVRRILSPFDIDLSSITLDLAA